MGEHGTGVLAAFLMSGALEAYEGHAATDADGR
jgi:hypothetical protein